MTAEDLTCLVARAQGGDGMARETILEEYRPFVAATASSLCHRPLDWHDDELSVGLIAFNEALDTYKAEAGAAFLTYARLVIRHRLYDHFRRERKQTAVVPLIPEEEGVEPGIVKQAWEHYQQEVLVRERAEELKAYQQELERFGLTLAEVARVCPKHRPTREKLLMVAATLSQDPRLAKQFVQQGRLPLQELIAVTGVNRKALERGRKYIVAVAIIFLRDEFSYLREYLQVPNCGG